MQSKNSLENIPDSTRSIMISHIELQAFLSKKISSIFRFKEMQDEGSIADDMSINIIQKELRAISNYVLSIHEK